MNLEGRTKADVALEALTQGTAGADDDDDDDDGLGVVVLVRRRPSPLHLENVTHCCRRRRRVHSAGYDRMNDRMHA